MESVQQIQENPRQSKAITKAEIKEKSSSHTAVAQEPQTFYTYVLQLNNGKYYTGLTGNLRRRLSEHAHGRSKSTKWHLPVKLIWYTELPTRQHARIIEVKIKKRGASRYLNLNGFEKAVYI